MSDIKSVLHMDSLVFDKICFTRKGFKNQNKIEYTLEAHFAEKKQENIYRVTLVLRGEKKKEYDFEISLTGFFSFDSEAEIDESLKQELISKNTLAIIMPYMRSQVSLLTAQPEMDCVVLPTFNINNLINGAEEQE